MNDRGRNFLLGSYLVWKVKGKVTNFQLGHLLAILHLIYFIGAASTTVLYNILPPKKYLKELKFNF